MWRRTDFRRRRTWLRTWKWSICLTWLHTKTTGSCWEPDPPSTSAGPSSLPGWTSPFKLYPTVSLFSVSGIVGIIGLFPVPAAPVSHEGAWEVLDSSGDGRSVRLHWREVSPEQQYGPDFGFSVNDIWRTDSQFVGIENVSLDDQVFKLSSLNKVFCLLAYKVIFC